MWFRGAVVGWSSFLVGFLVALLLTGCATAQPTITRATYQNIGDRWCWTKDGQTCTSAPRASEYETTRGFDWDALNQAVINANGVKIH